MYFFQIVHGVYRIVARDHNEVCGVEVYADARGIETVEEAFQDLRRFGTRFDREMRADGVRVFGELTAGVLHYFVSLVTRVGGNDADMSRYDVRLKLLRKIEYAL